MKKLIFIGLILLLGVQAFGQAKKGWEYQKEISIKATDIIVFWEDSTGGPYTRHILKNDFQAYLDSLGRPGANLTFRGDTVFVNSIWKYATGASANYVWTSNANGVGSWVVATMPTATALADMATIDTTAGGKLRIAAAAAGNGLTGGGGSALAVNPDNVTTEISSDVIRLKEAGTLASKTKRYIWKKVLVTDQLTEQTLVTASGQLTLGNLDSGQSALPTFAGVVKVEIVADYQERSGYISTVPSVSGGNVTFGLTLSASGNNAGDGNVYYDIVIEQL